VKRAVFLASCAAPFALTALPAVAQDLQTRTVPPPPPAAAAAAPANEDQVQFNAATLQYDINEEIVTATGDVRMYRAGDRLRADKVVWNRQTGKVIATGNIAIVNPGGDTAYGDSIELTDALKDGMVDNMLLVLEKGGRLAARKGTRSLNETVTLEDAAYTPCAVTTSENCPKEPSWKITAVRVIYRPERGRIYYKGARIDLLACRRSRCRRFPTRSAGGTTAACLAPTSAMAASTGWNSRNPITSRFRPTAA